MDNPYRDGTLLETPDGTRHLIVGGARFRLADPADLDHLRHEDTSAQPCESHELNRIPQVPRDFTLLRPWNSPSIAIIIAGARFHFSNMTEFGLYLNELGLERDVREIPVGGFNQIPVVPRDGILLQERSAREVFYVRLSRRWHIRDRDTFERYFDWNLIQKVPNRSLDQVPYGGLFRESGNSALADFFLRQRLRSRTTLVASLLVTILALGSAAAVFATERSTGLDPDDVISVMTDTVWWAFGTITGADLSEFSPDSIVGKSVGLVLSILGLALFGLVTGGIAALIIKAATTDTEVERLRLDELMHQLSDVKARLEWYEAAHEPKTEDRDGSERGP